MASIFAGGMAALLFQRFGSWSAAFYGSAALAMVACLMAIALRAIPLPTKVLAVTAAPLNDRLGAV